MALGNYTKSLNDLQKSKALDEHAEIRIDLAKVYVRMKQDDDAITELTMAIQDKQAPVAARAMLEGIYLRTQKTDKLEKFYLEHLARFPNNIYWKKQAAKLAAKQEQYDKALECLNRPGQSARI